MQNTTRRPVVTVTADGRGVASHAGSRLLADLAEVTGVPQAFGAALGGLRQRRSRHDPGRVLADVAVMLADGGEAISDLAVLRDQPELFGSVASTATAWRVLVSIDKAALGRLRQARAAARERAWLARSELGRALPAARAGGRVLPGLVIDVDASLVTCHSEKESAAATFKGGFGYHPLLAFLDNTGEALAGLLRPGNAGSNTAADHITVTDLALAQIPDTQRYGCSILVRADGAGATRDWLTYLRGLRDQDLDVEFSVGFTMTRAVETAIDALPKTAWTPAIEADGSVRAGADVAEITGFLDGLTAAGWPTGMRVIVRRERPHPGAQLSLFDQRDGLRYQAFATDTPRGQLAHLEARHRAHARVEDRIRQAKDTGIGRFPSRLFALNAAWLELALTAIDLITWTQDLLLDGDLATCEPKALRYRLLHTAARITRGQRRTYLRLAQRWTWARDLAAAFTRLALIPHPIPT
ncbi:IS1380 family transposase [Kribbella pittospori]|uniref:IS1380 family transposase n=1 Tax=Kribbella pittospori TaxID=722689 RepID=A0A4R0JIA4_9ACTN|nr:IS1380 family transposase [Kribbella pittospori]TCC44378.1 IS1380 family transposase [Kribbella pittospori]